jgi:membrane protein YdbS with pleckstrin-like domain
MSRLLTPLLISIGVLAAGVFAVMAYLMTGLIAIIAFGCVIVLAVLVLLGDLACRRYLTWREKRDMRIRNKRLARFNMAAFRGTKKTDRFLS